MEAHLNRNGAEQCPADLDTAADAQKLMEILARRSHDAEGFDGAVHRAGSAASRRS